MDLFEDWTEDGPPPARTGNLIDYLPIAPLIADWDLVATTTRSSYRTEHEMVLHCAANNGGTACWLRPTSIEPLHQVPASALRASTYVCIPCLIASGLTVPTRWVPRNDRVGA